MDLSPLKNNRDFRFLYGGQFIAFFGAMLTFVALPYQMYHITHSTLAVGLISLVQLVPTLIMAMIGGAYSDMVDRRKMIILAESGMSISCVLLAFNALQPEPSIWVLYFVGAMDGALFGLHRPAMDAMAPRMVAHHEIQAMSILKIFQSNVGMIGGPAAAGILIGTLGLFWVYMINLGTFMISIILLFQIKKKPPLVEGERPSLKQIKEAFKYAYSRQELMGTYLVDFMAMVFAMPNALFPAIAHHFASPKLLGWLYSAPAIGAVIATLSSRWAKHVHHHGRAVVFAALCWGAAILCVGATYQVLLILVFLSVAGAADCVSGIFRSTIWNETIPDRIRGRMSSLEIMSYMSGPMLGNAQAGAMASITSPPMAFMIGGSLCMIGVIVCTLMLPDFWAYYRGEIVAGQPDQPQS